MFEFMYEKRKHIAFYFLILILGEPYLYLKNIERKQIIDDWFDTSGDNITRVDSILKCPHCQLCIMYEELLKNVSFKHTQVHNNRNDMTRCF